jgi:uncharacterized protein with von Willebrand factor type A (vWA) domain
MIEQLNSIQTQLDNIQNQVNELKNQPVSTVSLIAPQSIAPASIASPKKIQVQIPKWKTDTGIKFEDGNNGRVKLSFDRINQLLSINIKKNDLKKNWNRIKQILNNVETQDEVNEIIKENKLVFGSNQIAGTKKKRKQIKRKQTKRYR